MSKIKFRVVNHHSEMKMENTFYLIKDNWNDWWKYETLFIAYYLISEELKYIGLVKIGSKHEQYVEGDGVIITELPSSFEQLPDEFFSLGQNVDYYQNLNSLLDEVRINFLKSLRDIAYDKNLLKEVRRLDVTATSLLRDLSIISVKDQFSRLAQGNAELTTYYFEYVLPGDVAPPIDFFVLPDSLPPTNIHALIGRNGVGKTRLLDSLVLKVLKGAEEYGRLEYDSSYGDEFPFANIINVSFSSFDKAKLYESAKSLIKIEVIGMHKLIDSEDSMEDVEEKNGKKLLKEFEDMVLEFEITVKKFYNDPVKVNMWNSTIRILESDPIIRELGIGYLVNKEYHERIKAIFRNLSSGHKIILFSLTRIIDSIAEKSLIIIDEPENHLHPPLLSSYIRALSSLLISNNAVAIIATHSPVVLQEVSRDSTWIMNRFGNEVNFTRPNIETFGENVGTLTREVFGLEVTTSGFHNILKDLVKNGYSYNKIIEKFEGKIGLEGKLILRALISKREKDESVE